MDEINFPEVKETGLLAEIAGKVKASEPLTFNDAVFLYKEASLGLLGTLANYIRVLKHGQKAFFNRNFHIEPTNICIYKCKFCSYSRKKGETGAWEFSIDEMLKTVEKEYNAGKTEVHIVGGVHPDKGLDFHCNLFSEIKRIAPTLHIKALSAIEHDHIFRLAKVSANEGFKIMKNSGLGSIPGGGAEIFNESIRRQICPEKANAERWLEVHRAAHNNGIYSNATILYGHIESIEHRVEHLSLLRNLQEETHMFNAFIPLKYRNQNNSLQYLGEVSLIEDMRNYAVSRIFLHNFPHIKAYWPMIGKEHALTALSFGADDMDGTIEDSTKIYSMAGGDKNPAMNTGEIVSLLKASGKIPVERDSLYNELKEY